MTRKQVSKDELPEEQVRILKNVLECLDGLPIPDGLSTIVIAMSEIIKQAPENVQVLIYKDIGTFAVGHLEQIKINQLEAAGKLSQH